MENSDIMKTKPRKVFISFLGTGKYTPCKYVIYGKPSKLVSFVQEALVEYLCGDWTDKDRILIFCTSKEKTGEDGSKEINWLDNGSTNATGEPEKVGLQHRLEDLKKVTGIKAKVEQFDIHTGFSEEEIWKIFNTVYTKLMKGDEIYFDVTHAFRSIPLFSIVLFNYSKFMKGTKVMSIMYGAFEKLGPAYKVREMPVDERLVPVIDLTNIIRLQEYNQVASNLMDFGRVSKLRDIIKPGLVNKENTDDTHDVTFGNLKVTSKKGGNKESKELIRLFKERYNIYAKNELDVTLDRLCMAITELDDYIDTINIFRIREGAFIKDFRECYQYVRKNGFLIEPISNLLNKLNNETADFIPGDYYRNLEAAINWAIIHNMLMQVYPLAQEYIVSRVADSVFNMDPAMMSKTYFRSLVSSVLGMKEDFLMSKIETEIQLQEQRQQSEEQVDNYPRSTNDKIAENPYLAAQIAEASLVKEIRPLYNPIRKFRNSLAHGLGNFSAEELKNGITDIVECLVFLNPGYDSYPSTQQAKDKLKDNHQD